jgi:pSer/pThr/pTyr-binding forkhead associated (FHA) protein
MPRLFVLSGNLVGRTYAVTGAATLGRGERCGLRLPDRSVSREHARLEPDAAGGWWVVDLGSRNGVKVNGERVERAALKDLDEVMLGELLLRFRTEAGEAAEAPLAPPPERPAAPWAPAPAPPAAPAPPLEEDDAGFELEEEIELGETRSTPREAAQEARPQVELTDRDRERARILAESRRGGLLGGDLGQWPWPLRWGAYLGAAAVTAGVFYGVYRLVLALKTG